MSSLRTTREMKENQSNETVSNCPHPAKTTNVLMSSSCKQEKKCNTLFKKYIYIYQVCMFHKKYIYISYRASTHTL